MKQLNAALLFLGLTFLGCLVWRIGPGELWQQMAALGWGVVPLILCEGLGNLAHALGWRHCMTPGGSRVPLPRLFRIAMAGFAVSYLTPSASLGGDLSRATLLASHQKGPEAVTSVLLDKLTTGFAHLILVTFGAIFVLSHLSLRSELLAGMAISTAMLTCGLTAFLVLQRRGKIGGVFRWLVEHRVGGRYLQVMAGRFSEVDEGLKQFYRERPRSLVRSIGWHLLGHSAALAELWLFLSLLKQPASPGMVAAAGFLSLWFDLLTFAVPLNLGTLEGSRVVVFKALGCPALLGMTFGVAVRSAQVFWACFGLGNYALFAIRTPRASTPQPALSWVLVSSPANELHHELRGTPGIPRETQTSPALKPWPCGREAPKASAQSAQLKARDRKAKVQLSGVPRVLQP